jgi:hypothetical protein
MPVKYTKEIKDKLNSISLSLLHKELTLLGYQFIREGGLEENKPFQFSNFLFYKHPDTSMNIRIGYERYPRLDGTYKNLAIFAICYSPKDTTWWIGVIPDFRKKQWRKISINYSKEVD